MPNNLSRAGGPGPAMLTNVPWGSYPNPLIGQRSVNRLDEILESQAQHFDKWGVPPVQIPPQPAYIPMTEEEWLEYNSLTREGIEPNPGPFDKDGRKQNQTGKFVKGGVKSETRQNKKAWVLAKEFDDLSSKNEAMRNIRCYGCGLMGHIQSKCPRNAPRVAMQCCLVCESPRHRTEECKEDLPPPPPSAAPEVKPPEQFHPTVDEQRLLAGSIDFQLTDDGFPSWLSRFLFLLISYYLIIHVRPYATWLIDPLCFLFPASAFFIRVAFHWGIRTGVAWLLTQLFIAILPDWFLKGTVVIESYVGTRIYDTRVKGQGDVRFDVLQSGDSKHPDPILLLVEKKWRPKKFGFYLPVMKKCELMMSLELYVQLMNPKTKNPLMTDDDVEAMMQRLASTSCSIDYSRYMECGNHDVIQNTVWIAKARVKFTRLQALRRGFRLRNPYQP